MTMGKWNTTWNNDEMDIQKYIQIEKKMFAFCQVTNKLKNKAECWMKAYEANERMEVQNVTQMN